MPEIDLNADVGESFGVWTLGDDAAVLAAVTSANVACGFHAGDPRTILATVRAAATGGVAVGAQVAYPDLVGFGRRDLDCTPAEVTADVLYQIGAVDGLARSVGVRVAYVKPHGALYNRAAADPSVAVAIATALSAYGGDLPLLLLAGSAGARAAGAHGVPVVPEAFADRAYTPDGRLVSRREPGAVIDDAELTAERAVRMACGGSVIAVDGSTVRIAPRSICLHGDTPGAAATAGRVRRALEAAGVAVRAFR